MPKKLLILISFLLAVTVLSLFIVVVLPDKAFQDQELETVPKKLTEPQITFLDPIRGNKKAKITIVEYGDFNCPLCKSIEPVMQEIITQDKNNRRFIWKDAPIVTLHADAFTASMAARCAQDQGKFWDYHDALIKQGVSLDAQSLSNIAEQIQLDTTTFQNCMASDITRPVVQHTLEEAVALDISGTPTVFINGIEYTGPYTIDGINEVIERL